MTKEEAILVLQNDAYVLYEDDSPYDRQAYDMAIKALKERKRGKWLITDRYHDFMDGTELTIWKCSECGDEFSLEGERPTKKYCSNCGARMVTGDV